MTEERIATETLIVGFGLTAIPLIRELEREGRPYTVISSGGSVWDQLERMGRLDFDLVSSYMSSVFSFEQLVSQRTKSEYPTSREFHEIIAKYKRRYGERVIDDWVTEIVNHPSHSVVRTRSGRVYEAEHVVLATAFRRKISDTIFDFDFEGAKDETIVLAHMGDSANLILSKLLPRGNRIILLNDGFFCLDKMVVQDGVAYALDDIEMHNIGQLSGYIYKVGLPQGQLAAASRPSSCKPWFGANFFVQHPRAARDIDRTPALDVRRGSPFDAIIPNGIKVIKYWPIDVYREMFEDTLEESIERGYLLNDIAYFVEHGLVELWPRSECSLDRDHSVLRWGDEVIEYDEIIDGDQEAPHLPPIIIERPGQPRRRFQYQYRECFMGMLPPELPGVYLLGHTRPMTGGLNNISEMQCLLTHKLITDPPFRREITRNIDARIEAYNARHYPSRVRRGADNLVFYGQYTEDIARLMHIQPRVTDCRSLEDLSIHYFFPNVPGKYRQRGPYALEGMATLVRDIHRQHRGYAMAKSQIANFALTLGMIVLGLVMLYVAQPIPFPLPVLLLLLAAVIASPALSLINANSNRISGFLNAVLVAGLACTAYTRSPLVPVGVIAFNFMVVYICRRLRVTRVWFNDMAHKSREDFETFYRRYCEAFLRVAKRRAQATADDAT